MSFSSIVRYSGAHDWSALYVDGKLDTVGDHYHIDERISALLGVEERDSEDFMCGGEYREDVAKTLEEAEAYGAKREAKRETERELLEKAAQIMEEVERLRSEK